MKKIKKGEFGYIIYKKKTQSIITVFLLVLSVSVYALGFYSTGSNANLLTYVAILGCLPMAKFAVSAIMFFKAKGCSLELKEKLNASNVEPTFYDLFFTSFKKNYQISVALFKKQTFIMLSEDKDIDVSESEEHVKSVFKNCGYDDCLVKLYTDSDKFIQRAIELNKLDDEAKDYEFLFDNILSVSL